MTEKDSFGYVLTDLILILLLLYKNIEPVMELHLLFDTYFCNSVSFLCTLILKI